MAAFAAGFWPPAHDPEFLRMLVRPLVDTVVIAFLGMSLALALAIPLSLVAALPPTQPGTRAHRRSRKAMWIAARALLNLMRSIPELIWALLFVRVLGIGPAAGVLAIGVGYGGVVGKVFAEILESHGQVGRRALTEAGAPSMRAFVFGQFPSAAPLMVSYALYRFDCALRSSSVLGLVGAGGLGMQLELSMKMFAYDEVATLVLVIFTLVAIADGLSRRLRRNLTTTRGIIPVGRRGVLYRLALVATWIALLIAGAWFLDLPVREVFSTESVRTAAEFGRSLFPPDLSADFLSSIGRSVLDTLAISFFGTAVAVVIGLCLAFPSVIQLEARSRSAAWRGVRVLATGLANIGRTLPEMLWALVFIFAVGLGPFAGAVALALHTGGVLGRLYSEVVDEVPKGPVQAVLGAGAPNVRAAFFAVWPQAFVQLVSYALYRWEVNIRAAAVVGLVGAGGLGKQLYLSLSLFQNHRTLTLVGAILVLVTAVDLCSAWIRHRLVAGQSRSTVLSGRTGDVLIDGERVVILKLSTAGAEVYLRQDHGRLLAGVTRSVVLEVAGTPPVECVARVGWRREERAGVFLFLSFDESSALARMRVRRMIRRRTRTYGAPPPVSVEAF
jgi:phosphonate transport system permease protein